MELSQRLATILEAAMVEAIYPLVESIPPKPGTLNHPFKGSINVNGGGFASFRRDFGWFGEKNLAGYAGLWVEAWSPGVWVQGLGFRL